MSVLEFIFLFIIKPIQKHLWPTWTFYWPKHWPVSVCD